VTAAPRAALAAVGLLVLAHVGWGLFPEAALFADPLTPRVLLAASAVGKLACLLAGALLAFACRDRLEEGNPARPAWALLSAGLFATLAGQLSLAPWQVFANATPFPSAGDLFFVLSYPFFIAAFLVFLRAYGEAGLPMGSWAERATIVLGVGLAGGLAVLRTLQPVAAGGGGELIERILTLAYPLLDLVLLLPLALLTRIALRLRGSHAGAVWGLVLAGFVSLCLADIFFAWFTALGHEHLDPWLHAAYLLSYALVAAGAGRQLRLLRP
jgi:hypothetical protein